jgi:hypothetical protein
MHWRQMHLAHPRHRLSLTELSPAVRPSLLRTPVVASHRRSHRSGPIRAALVLYQARAPRDASRRCLRSALTARGRQTALCHAHDDQSQHNRLNALRGPRYKGSAESWNETLWCVDIRTPRGSGLPGHRHGGRVRWVRRGHRGFRRCGRRRQWWRCAHLDRPRHDAGVRRHRRPLCLLERLLRAAPVHRRDLWAERKREHWHVPVSRRRGVVHDG